MQLNSGQQLSADRALTELSGLHRRQMRSAVAFAGLYALMLGGGFWYVATGAGAGWLTLGDVALYLAAAVQAQTHLSHAALWTTSIREGLHFLGTFFAFEDQARPAIVLPPEGTGLAAPAALGAGIELRGVCFRYPEANGDVLEDVSALLPAGQVTALVGATGAGKSTIVKLLTRMYDPTDGEIMLDGRPLAAYDLASRRGRLPGLRPVRPVAAREHRRRRDRRWFH